MTPVILVGQVQTMSGQVLYVHMNVLINAKQFSMRHIISWAWRLLVGLQSEVVFVCRIYLHMYVCMYVCTYVRTYVCTYVYVCSSFMLVRTYIRAYIRTYVRMYVCMYMYVLYVCNSFMLVCIPHCHARVCSLQQ